MSYTAANEPPAVQMWVDNKLVLITETNKLDGILGAPPLVSQYIIQWQTSSYWEVTETSNGGFNGSEKTGSGCGARITTRTLDPGPPEARGLTCPEGVAIICWCLN